MRIMLAQPNVPSRGKRHVGIGKRSRLNRTRVQKARHRGLELFKIP